jgi:hypothetical protein
VSSRTPRQRQRAEDRLGADGVARLIADYQAGRSTKWLQRTYGLSQGGVLRLHDVAGVPRRKRGLSNEQVEEAIRLYAAGWSLTRIGDYFGKDHTRGTQCSHKKWGPRPVRGCALRMSDGRQSAVANYFLYSS